MRYTREALVRWSKLRPRKSDVVQMMRRIVLANYFSDPLLHDVGWLYGSDDVRALFDANVSEFDARSRFSETRPSGSPRRFQGFSRLRGFAEHQQIRTDVAMLFRSRTML